jgi:hypothetical protein
MAIALRAGSCPARHVARQRALGGKVDRGHVGASSVSGSRMYAKCTNLEPGRSVDAISVMPSSGTGPGTVMPVSIEPDDKLFHGLRHARYGEIRLLILRRMTAQVSDLRHRLAAAFLAISAKRFGVNPAARAAALFRPISAAASFLPVVHHISHLAGSDIADQVREHDRITGAGKALGLPSGRPIPFV